MYVCVPGLEQATTLGQVGKMQGPTLGVVFWSSETGLGSSLAVVVKLAGKPGGVSLHSLAETGQVLMQRCK